MITKEFFTLSNGLKMPKIGIGTYKLMPHDEAYNAVFNALKEGVRHIDSAIIYRNEESVRKAIEDANIPRDELFITSKLPPHIKNYQGAIRMFEKTLKNLGMDYLDCYIINAPGPFHDLDGDYDEGNVLAYQALIDLYKEKRVRSIGVSQFKIKDIENLITHTNFVPHVQQLSFFVGHVQDELVRYCQSKAIQLQAFSPLAKGYLLNNPVLVSIAKKHQLSPSQVALRYIIQKGIVPFPKASSPEHIKLNTQLNFKLSDVAMSRLDDVNDDPRIYDDAV